ncbi:MAG TPA: LxmA leader domain family RiPP [Jatrophihabitantaceae bacterium]|nr:LxmA leader domain family RiPP [Jatrophihabitantaceae bacterium]
MSTAERLITGYTAYTDADELGAGASAEAPATTPVLSFIATSTAVCGGAVGSVISASAAGTVNWGC